MTEKVTVWHNGVRNCFPLLSVKTVSAVDKNGIKQKGFFDSSNAIIRIPSETYIDFSIGDFVRFGEHLGEADRTADFKVMEIHNNLRGTTPHYKLVCEK